MVIEGPWEPVYRIVKAKMPPIRSMGQITDLGMDMQQRKEFIRFATPMRCVAMAEHAVKPGREQAFEQGAIETMEALSDSTGFLGYMILKQIGVCALGSFMFDPTSMGEALQTLGANPPKNPEPLVKTPEAMPSPPEYLIHTECDAVDVARLGFPKVLVNHRHGLFARPFACAKGNRSRHYRLDIGWHYEPEAFPVWAGREGNRSGEIAALRPKADSA